MTVLSPLVLRDIHLPPAPSWWPPAPGWWLLAALLVVLLGVALFAWRRRHRRRIAIRRVLADIDALALSHADDDTALATGLHQLLRRAARRYDANAAQQRGDAWRQTLARIPTDAAMLDALMTLEPRMYRPDVAFDRAQALMATRRWLEGALRRAPRAVAETGHA